MPNTPFEIPVGWRTVNPLLIDARRLNNNQDYYTDISQVLSENPIPIRREDQIYNVSDGNGGFIEYWFKNGINEDPIPRNVNLNISSISELINSTRFKLGDVVNVKGYYEGSDLGGGFFYTIQDRRQWYLPFISSGLQSLYGDGLTMPLQSGESIEITFRYSSNPNTDYMASFGSGNAIRLAFQVGGTTEDYAYSDLTNYATLNWIKDFYGNVVDKIALKYNVWYTISILPSTVIPVTFPYNVSRVRVGNALSNYPTFDIQRLKVGDYEFSLNEGSGTTVKGYSSDPTPIEVDLTIDSSAGVPELPVWTHVSYDNGFDLFEAGEVLFKRKIEHNTVSPFDFGVVAAINIDDYSNDSSVAMQSWLDSGYNLVVPPCFIYVASGLNIDKPVSITMSGNYKVVGDNPPHINQSSSTSIIFTDQNIDVFSIKSRCVDILNGLVYVGGVTNYTKACFRWDINYEIWSGTVTTNCLGNKDNLINTGIGGYAYHFDTSVVNNYGFFEDITVHGDGYYFDKQVYVPSIPTNGYGSWHNGFTFTCRGDGCKTFFHIESSKTIISGMQQDRAILNTAEKGLPGVYLRLLDAYVDAFIFDAKEEVSEPYRHFDNIYDIQGTNVNITGLMLRQYSTGRIDTGKSMLHDAHKLDNPNGYLLSDNQGIVSDTKNAIKYAGDEGVVSINGYLAPNSLYFSNGNTLPANDAGNPDGALSVSPDVTITNGGNLLTSGNDGNYLVSSKVEVIGDEDLSFTEIVITDLDTIQGFTGNDKISGLYLTCGRNIKQIQTVVEFLEGTYDNLVSCTDKTSQGGGTSYLLLNNSGAYKEYKIRSIIIRLIGTYDHSSTRIRDIVVNPTRKINPPVIGTSGSQTIYGGLNVESLNINGIPTYGGGLVGEPNYVSGDSVSANRFCVDDGWSGYSLQATSEPLAPQPSGAIETVINTSTATPTLSSHTGVVNQKYTVTYLEDGWNLSLEIIAPNATFDTYAKVVITDLSNGDKTVYDNVIVNGGDWVTLASEGVIVAAGTVFEVELQMYNNAPASAIEGSWVSNIGTTTTAGVIAIDNVSNPSLIEYNHTDNDSVDRSAELDAVVVGSIIRINEVFDTGRFIEAEVTVVDTSPANSTIYTVTPISIGKNVRDSQLTSNIIDIPISLPTEFNTYSGYLTSNPVTFATITSELFYDGVNQSAPSNDGYGINFSFQKAFVSTHWKRVSHNQVSGGGSGVSTDSFSPELVYVKSLSDLPTPSGGEIQLQDNRVYIPLFTSAQSMSDTLVFGNDTTWYTSNSNLGAWTYTGSTSAIKASGGNGVFIFGMQVTMTNPIANLLDFDGNSGVANLVIERMTSIGGNIGTSNDSLFTFIKESQFIGFDDGLLLTGSHSDVSVNTCRFQTYNGIAVDLGIATTDSFLMNQTRFSNGGVSSFCLSGLASSANIVQRAVLSENIWNGNGTSLQNVTNRDIRYRFVGNTGNEGIEDSGALVSTYIGDGDEASTVIGAINTEYVISGTWTEVESSRFTTDAAGKLTYIGLEKVKLFVSTKLLADPASGTNKEYWFYIRKNGTDLDLLSRDVVSADAASPSKVVLQTEVELSTADYLEIIVEAKTDTTNLTCSGANFIVS